MELGEFLSETQAEVRAQMNDGARSRRWCSLKS